MYRPVDERLFHPSLSGPVAQRLEQGTHNPLVVGSNPTGPTSFTGGSCGELGLTFGGPVLCAANPGHVASLGTNPTGAHD